jgi:hypothetical protein
MNAVETYYESKEKERLLSKYFNRLIVYPKIVKAEKYRNRNLSLKGFLSLKLIVI